MIKGWIRIRLGILEMGKWMAFMRVGELVAKLWLVWVDGVD